jgi:molecular chaperone GrpE
MSDTEHETPPAQDIPPAEGAAEGSDQHSQTIARLETEIAETRDRLLRALAEVDNVRRRGEREREDTARYAISRFAGDLLSVADNLRRALEAVPPGAQDESQLLGKLVDGVGATEREMQRVFEKNGLKRLDPSGQKFDPNFHEVLFELEQPDLEPGRVVQVLEAGYTVGDRLLRPARVAVSKAPPHS